METIRNIALCIIILITYNAISFAQINQVANPSFEEIDSCPVGFSQFNNITGWSTPINGGGGDPELYNICCTLPSHCGVPTQSFVNSSQYPHFGNSYAGFDAVCSINANNFREYIQSKLKKKLLSGNNYCVKFFVSLSDQSNAYIKPLGVYLDNGSVTAPAPHGLALVTPQVYNTTQSLSDTVNWMKIEGSFVALGNEEYITIGNFFTDANSDIGLKGAPTFWFAYYYIDDVSVIDASLPAFAGKDTLIYPGDSVFIGRHPEIGLDEDCIWFVNGLPIDTVAGIWVKPDSNTTYILQQTICGNVSYDTVNITVGFAGINEFTSLSDNIEVYPNPNNGTFTISLNGNNSISESAEVRVLDILGNQINVVNLYLKKNIAIFDMELSNGIYFISVKDSKGNIYNPKKIIVIK